MNMRQLTHIIQNSSSTVLPSRKMRPKNDVLRSLLTPIRTRSTRTKHPTANRTHRPAYLPPALPFHVPTHQHRRSSFMTRRSARDSALHQTSLLPPRRVHTTRHGSPSHKASRPAQHVSLIDRPYSLLLFVWRRGIYVPRII